MTHHLPESEIDPYDRNDINRPKEYNPHSNIARLTVIMGGLSLCDTVIDTKGTE